MKPRIAVALGLGVLLGAGPGCGPAEEAPVTTAKAFNVAVRSGDSKRVIALLDAEAVDQLEGLAQGASDQVGGRRKVEPHEMLQVVDVDRAFELSSAELLDNDGERAHVALESTTGERHVLSLIKQGDRWRVQVPLPGDVAHPQVPRAEDAPAPTDP